MDCPVCKAPMIVVERSDIELDNCLVCKGIWFDEGELELLSEALKIKAEIPDFASIPATASNEKIRKCPRCKRGMDKILVGPEGGILIDRCPAGHGLWFDWGELGQLLERSAKTEGGADEHMIKFLGETIRH